jgi:hypothetical protein
MSTKLLTGSKSYTPVLLCEAWYPWWWSVRKVIHDLQWRGYSTTYAVGFMGNSPITRSLWAQARIRFFAQEKIFQIDGKRPITARFLQRCMCFLVTLHENESTITATRVAASIVRHAGLSISLFLRRMIDSTQQNERVAYETLERILMNIIRDDLQWASCSSQRWNCRICTSTDVSSLGSFSILS